MVLTKNLTNKTFAKRNGITLYNKMFKDETLKILKQDGYDGYGEPLV